MSSSTAKRDPSAAGPATREPGEQDRAIRALMSVVEDLTTQREEEGLLCSTLQHVVEALGTSGGATFLAEPDDGGLSPAAAVDLSPADTDQARELSVAAIRAGQPRVTETADGGWFALAPMVVQDRRLGVFVLRDTSGHASIPGPELLEALGRQIGTGLENMRHYVELKSSWARVEMLNRITASLTSGRDLKTVVPAFAREIAASESFDRLACAFVNDTGDYIEVVGHPEEACWGLGDVIPVVGSGPGAVVLNGSPLFQGDLIHSHRFIEDMRLLEEGIRSYVLLPLNAQGRIIGVVALGSKEAGAYDDSTISRLQPVVDAVALPFENVRLFQRTRELSITDELTPLYNVRYFHQILERELKLVDRYRSVLSLIFVDLDRFKPINDRYGHLRGSRVLREVGFLLRMAVRETDYPVRYGGDEFVVVLPQTDHPAATALGVKLRELIEGHTFLQEEGIDAKIGLSFGVATYPEEAASKETLIQLADERMYADKDVRKAE
jgi:diguanylate cyclase (GGDEF)-like protein